MTTGKGHGEGTRGQDTSSARLTRGVEVKVVESQHEEVEHQEHEAGERDEVWGEPCGQYLLVGRSHGHSRVGLHIHSKRPVSYGPKQDEASSGRKTPVTHLYDRVPERVHDIH